MPAHVSASIQEIMPKVIKTTEHDKSVGLNSESFSSQLAVS